MMKKYYLTVDLGASNGRGIIFSFDGSRLTPEEEYRFPNAIVTRDGADRWDFTYLLSRIKETLRDVAAKYPLRSVSIDTWGLDFGLLDQDGTLLADPVSYRDPRTEGVPERVCAVVPPEELYRITGIQRLNGNTLYQLFAMREREPELLDRAATLLMMPDLLAYCLTGARSAEYTISTTTQMLDITQRRWSRELLERLGLPSALLPPLVRPGCHASPLLPQVCRELGLEEGLPLVKAASHDTASAIIALPTTQTAPLYVSSGTWSVLGTELSEPLLCEAGYRGNFANEGGFGDSVRYCCSLTGLWLLQECVRIWRNRGISYDYATLDTMAQSAPAFASLFDPQHPAVQGKCDMPAVISALCAENGTARPSDCGEFCRAIYEAIALNYRRAIEKLERITSRHYDTLYIVGGGSRAAFLNQCIANATGKSVIAGLPEATAYGNAFAQLYYDKEFTELTAFRGMLLQTEPLRRYLPEDQALWNAAYTRFARLSDLEGANS